MNINRDTFYSTREAVHEAYFRIWDYNERSTRSSFWLFQLAQLFVLYLLSYIHDLVFIIFKDIIKLDSSGMEILNIVLIILYIIPLALINIPLLCRRLADSGKSPLLIFPLLILLWFIPDIGFLAIFILCCFDSERGRNKWGPSLKYPDKE